MQLKPSISVFFPCYNDSHSIKKLVIDAYTTLKKIANKYEVIVIDDGSTDNSKKILEKLAVNYKKLKTISHETNKGYGGALQTGFHNATYEWIFYTDGDGQYDVKNLTQLVQLVSGNVDFVNGIKIDRKDPTYRVVAGNIYSFLIRWLFWTPIHDIDCDFRLIRKKIIEKITLKSTSGSICVELIKKTQRAGARFQEVGIPHFERRFGHSQFFQPKRILHTFRDLFVLWISLMLLKRN